MRKIIHVDMDAFFASVEQHDDPALRGRPVLVGGDPGGRGVVAAASYEARRFGVRSAMPCAEAARRCPQAVFLRPRMSRYVEVSQQIRAIFREVTELVEPLSLDEAYLDVTDNALGEPLAGKVALHLKARVRAITGLTASAGVGPNKLVAKIASDMRKPDGLFIVPPDAVQAFLDPLPVDKLWGVGPATRDRLHALGIKRVVDLRQRPLDEITRRFGQQGAFMHALARGDDARRVTPYRAPKSRGAERTFSEDIREVDALLEILAELARRVAASIGRLERQARTVTLKVRYSDFSTVTRARTLPDPFDGADTIHSVAADLLHRETDAGRRPVRLLGVSVSGFADDDAPLQLVLPLDAPGGGAPG